MMVDRGQAISGEAEAAGIPADRILDKDAAAAAGITVDTAGADAANTDAAKTDTAAKTDASAKTDSSKKS